MTLLQLYCGWSNWSPEDDVVLRNRDSEIIAQFSVLEDYYTFATYMTDLVECFYSSPEHIVYIYLV